MWKLAASMLLAGACASAEEDVTTVDPDLPAQADQTEAPTQINFVPAGTGIDRATCQANGPCDAACDAALVEELFVPQGTCVVFDCGANLRVGGCNDT